MVFAIANRWIAPAAGAWHEAGNDAGNDSGME